MSDPTITKSEVDALLAPLFNLAGIRASERQVVSPVKFHVPLTRTTSVAVEFFGPVGIDEYDALLAHVAFYKQLVPKEGEEKLGGGDFVGQLRAVVDKIWTGKPASPEGAA